MTIHRKDTPIALTPRLERRRSFASMGTDTMSGLNRIGEVIKQYQFGLITEQEALERL